MTTGMFAGNPEDEAAVVAVLCVAVDLAVVLAEDFAVAVVAGFAGVVVGVVCAPAETARAKTRSGAMAFKRCSPL